MMDDLPCSFVERTNYFRELLAFPQSPEVDEFVRKYSHEIKASLGLTELVLPE